MIVGFLACCASANTADMKNVKTINYIYGLGGVDVKVDDILSIYKKLNEIAKNGNVDKTTYYLGYED